MNSDLTPRRTWWIQAALVGGVIALILLPLGALGARFGIWPFSFGFLLSAGALLLATVGLVLALMALIFKQTRNIGVDRSGAFTALALCGVVAAVVTFTAAPAFRLPPIHDVSTDISDPPEFSTALMQLRGEKANPLARDAIIDHAQMETYADLGPITSSLAPAEALTQAERTARSLSWEVVHVDATAGVLEATATTFWYGFKDDIVVRVRPSRSGSTIDLRSVSRIGQGDLGANAARIRAFAAAFGKS